MEKLDFVIFTENDEKNIFTDDDYLNEPESTRENIFCPGIYFHGKLEKDLGFDLVYESSQKYFSSYLENIKIGEQKTVSLKANINGTLKTVKAFLWRPKEEAPHKIRGLICYPNDTKAINYAKTRQNAMSKFI